MNDSDRLQEVLLLLNMHYASFTGVKPFADKYGHPHPTDTRGWSQILVSALTGVPGISRKKGADLDDGSDVKAANTWGAIDTPRFNGCLKAGTKAEYSDSIASLNDMPSLYLVLWDNQATAGGIERFRIWVVKPQTVPLFRAMCENWYSKRRNGEIKSNNFQLHPPRNQDSNVIRNTCGNLVYPLLFCAVRTGQAFQSIHYDPSTLVSGACTLPS